MRETAPRAGRAAERGQAILEFALIVPMLFIMLVGVVYFAMAFNLQQVLNNAAYEGARVWAKNPPGGSYNQCSPPACNPNGDPLTENNFEKYIKPIVRQCVANNGFDASGVIFYSENDQAYQNLVNYYDQDKESVTVTILYTYNLPIGNFASSFVPIKLSASCTLKRG